MNKRWDRVEESKEGLREGGNLVKVGRKCQLAKTVSSLSPLLPQSCPLMIQSHQTIICYTSEMSLGMY